MVVLGQLNSNGWRERLSEHTNLGRRCMEIIREFRPDYVLMNEKELAEASHSLPALSIS